MYASYILQLKTFYIDVQPIIWCPIHQFAPDSGASHSAIASLPIFRPAGPSTRRQDPPDGLPHRADAHPPSPPAHAGEMPVTALPNGRQYPFASVTWRSAHLPYATGRPHSAPLRQLTLEQYNSVSTSPSGIEQTYIAFGASRVRPRSLVCCPAVPVTSPRCIDRVPWIGAHADSHPAAGTALVRPLGRQYTRAPCFPLAAVIPCPFTAVLSPRPVAPVLPLIPRPQSPLCLTKGHRPRPVIPTENSLLATESSIRG